jgi:hypothetical protein
VNRFYWVNCQCGNDTQPFLAESALQTGCLAYRSRKKCSIIIFLAKLEVSLVNHNRIQKDREEFSQSVSHWMGGQNLLSRSPPCVVRHVKPLVPVAFAVVSTHSSFKVG